MVVVNEVSEAPTRRPSASDDWVGSSVQALLDTKSLLTLSYVLFLYRIIFCLIILVRALVHQLLLLLSR